VLILSSSKNTAFLRETAKMLGHMLGAYFFTRVYFSFELILIKRFKMWFKTLLSVFKDALATFKRTDISVFNCDNFRTNN